MNFALDVVLVGHGGKMDATVKQRLIHVDRLKGFAIFLVVLGHVIQFNSSNFTSNPLFSVIYSFHMPLFFFISGYLAEKTTKSVDFYSYGRFVGKKALVLLMPLFTWALVTSYLFTGDRDTSKISGILLRQITSPGLWFLHTLFLIFVVYGLVRIFQDRLINVNGYVQILLHGFVLGGCLGLSKVFPGTNVLPYMLNYGFFSLGAVLARREELTDYILNKWVHMGAVVTFFYLVAYFEFDQLGLMKMKGIKVVLSVVAIMGLYAVARKIVLPSLVDKWLSILSASSLAIYVTHFSFAHLVPKELITVVDLRISVMIAVLLPITAYIIGLCLVVERIVMTCPILDLLLYGRWKKDAPVFGKNVSPGSQVQAS